MRKIFFTLILASAIYSCNHNETHEVFTKKNLVTESQLIYLNLSKNRILHGKEGTTLIFPAGCLDQDTGIVIVKLQEYYNLPEMLLEKLTTTSGLQVLETDGMVNIAIESEVGKKVCLANGKSFEIKMPKSKDNMSLFYGKKIGDNIDWMISKEAKQSTVDSIPSYHKNGSYNYFESTKLGWINADKFTDFKRKTDLIVSLPESQSGASCNLVIDKYNSIIPGIVENGKLVFKGIPANTKATLIALGTNKKSQFICMIDLNTNDKFIELPLLQPMAIEEIKSMLEKKFGKSLKRTNQ